MTTDSTSKTQSIFRKAAIEQHAARHEAKGRPLRLSPIWVTWTYRLIVLTSLAGILFLCFANMNDYAVGTGLVQESGKVVVTNVVSATVVEIAVTPGVAVRKGQILIRIEDHDQRATVARIEKEIETNVLLNLNDPTDVVARRNIALLLPQLTQAKERLEKRRLYAPCNGVVSDIRTRTGQVLHPGQAAVTILKPESRMSLAMVLPGHYSPQLAPGQVARFEVDGYSNAYVPVTLVHVADEVIGPSETRRYLGSEFGDALPLSGPLLLAEGALSAKSFVADGERYPLADGMQGQVQIRLRSVPIILNLLPGIRRLFRGKDYGFTE